MSKDLEERVEEDKKSKAKKDGEKLAEAIAEYADSDAIFKIASSETAKAGNEYLKKHPSGKPIKGEDYIDDLNKSAMDYLKSAGWGIKNKNGKTDSHAENYGFLIKQNLDANQLQQLKEAKLKGDEVTVLKLLQEGYLNLTASGKSETTLGELENAPNETRIKGTEKYAKMVAGEDADVLQFYSPQDLRQSYRILSNMKDATSRYRKHEYKKAA